MKMTLEAGGSTQMFSLTFFHTSISLPLSHIHWREEEKTREEVGGGREKKRKATENAETRQLSK